MRVPSHLEAEWKGIVDKWFDGDEQEAFCAAVESFIREQKKRIPKSKAFDSALEKVHHRQSHTDEILSDGLSSALDKMKKRREKGLPI